MAKKTKTIFGIFTESIGLYFSNFDKFIKYMTFPVLGQIAGLALIFGITYLYTANLPKLLAKYPNLDNLNTLIVLSVLITLPGLAIFMKAFWEYLVAYGAINSMYDNMQKSGRVYDFEAHTELIKRRSVSFVGLWLMLGIFTVIALLPPCWVLGGILAVYFVLVFQVFTYEPELKPAECFKKSLLLIKGHFASTFLLICLIGSVTYIFIPQIMGKLFDILLINKFVSNSLLPILNTLTPPSGINISMKEVSQIISQSLVLNIFVQYTLPMRSLLWAMWYKELNHGIPKDTKEPAKPKKSAKRPSEKLMEESAKKYGRKKLDRNILKRASQKDDSDEF